MTKGDAVSQAYDSQYDRNRFKAKVRCELSVREFREGDFGIYEDLCQRYGDIGDLEFWGRAYVDLDDAGIPNTDIPRKARLSGTLSLDGLPLFIRHCYSTISPFAELNPSIWAGKNEYPTSNSRPLGHVVASVVTPCGDVYVKCRIDKESLSQGEVDRIRHELRSKGLGDLSLGYAIPDTPEKLKAHMDAIQRWGFVSIGPTQIDSGKMLFVHELSLTPKGFFHGTNIIAVRASLETTALGSSPSDPSLGNTFVIVSAYKWIRTPHMYPLFGLSYIRTHTYKIIQ